jgi:hypothetical protein
LSAEQCHPVGRAVASKKHHSVYRGPFSNLLVRSAIAADQTWRREFTSFDFKR